MRETYVEATRVIKDLLSGLRGYNLTLTVYNDLASILEEDFIGLE
jgi:hypothetical protein